MNDLTLIRPEADVSMEVFDSMRTKCEYLIKSKFLPVAIDTPEKAVAVALTGRELGIPMMLSFQEIHVIQGKPACSGKLMLALARRTKEVTEFDYSDDGKTATLTIRRNSEKPVTTSFSMDDAQAMGLIGKDNWKKQPKVMRQWRVVAANLRLTFPDAIGGLYTPEELNPDIDVDEYGKPIKPADLVTPSKPPIPRPVQKSAQPTAPNKPPQEPPYSDAQDAPPAAPAAQKAPDYLKAISGGSQRHQRGATVWFEVALTVEDRGKVVGVSKDEAHHLLGVSMNGLPVLVKLGPPAKDGKTILDDIKVDDTPPTAASK